MIIEIKDLPKDRNVKKISFDIEFEDSVKITEIAESSKISQDSTKREFKEVQEVQEVQEMPKIENSIVPPSIDISKREPKVDEDIMSLEF